jgi:hypothetical protein
MRSRGGSDSVENRKLPAGGVAEAIDVAPRCAAGLAVAVIIIFIPHSFAVNRGGSGGESWVQWR